MPLGQNEGPIGMVICPSRELATQTYEIADMYCKVRRGCQHRYIGSKQLWAYHRA